MAVAGGREGVVNGLDQAVGVGLGGESFVGMLVVEVGEGCKD